MNPKNFFSKTMSVVASLALTLGGSIVATQPSFAAATNTVAPVVSGTAAVGSTLTSNSGTWSESGFAMYGWLRCDSSVSAQQRIGGPAGNPAVCTAISNAMNSTYVLTQADQGKYISSVVTWMAQSGSPEWISASTTQVAAQQQSVTYTNTSAATFTMSNGIATYTPGTWTASNSSTPTVSFLWLFCDSSHNADSGSSGGPAADCGPIAATDISGTSPSSNSWIRTNPLSLPATAFKWVNSNGGIVTVASASLTTKHIAVYESVNGNWKVSATSAVTETAQASTEQVTRSVERSIPTSVFQAPILNSLAPKMTGGFSSTGGRLVMKDVKPADISSVMLNGKKVEVIASKSGSALRIPAGAGAGDLTFTMADGTVLTVANAVKITPSQVDPKLVDLNPLPTFKAGSVAVPAAIKSALNKRKAIILDSASAKCVGYASSNTAAARATALSRASNVCGVITDINENIEPIVKVLVNKTVAKKSPVKYQTW
jgi:hypothetical protein